MLNLNADEMMVLLRFIANKRASKSFFFCQCSHKFNESHVELIFGFLLAPSRLRYIRLRHDCVGSASRC